VAIGALAAVIGLTVVPPASACATCFGAEDSGMTKGMNSGILTLLACIGLVQVGFVAMFTGFIVRSRRLKAHKDRFRLIRGGTS
jgi:hypothetical protein